MDLKVPGGKCLGIILSRRVFDKETGLVIPDDEIDYQAEKDDDYSDDEGESRRPDSRMILTQIDPDSCLQKRMAIGDEVTHINNIMLAGMTYKEYQNIMLIFNERRKSLEGLDLILRVDFESWKEARRLQRAEEANRPQQAEERTQEKKRPWKRSACFACMTSGGRAPPQMNAKKRK